MHYDVSFSKKERERKEEKGKTEYLNEKFFFHLTKEEFEKF